MFVKVLKIDPRSWIMGWVIYCILSGTSLAGPGQLLATAHAYTIMYRWEASGVVWGSLMYADALLLIIVLFLRESWLEHIAKATVVVLSASFWVLVGLAMIFSASKWGYFSAAGAWSICGGLILMLSTAQLGRQL